MKKIECIGMFLGLFLSLSIYCMDIAVDKLKIEYEKAVFSTDKMEAAIKVAEFYKNKGSLDNALEWYNKVLSIETTVESGERLQEQAAIQKKAIGTLLVEKAQELINKNNIKEAKKMLQELAQKRIVAAIKLLQELEKNEDVPEKPTTEKISWIKLMKMPNDAVDDEEQDRDWRVKDGWLELINLAKDPLLLSTVEDVIEEADEQDLPCLIILVKSGEKTYNFYEAISLIDRIVKIPRDAGIADPLNRQFITEILLFVKEKNAEHFTLLKKLESPLQPRKPGDYFGDDKKAYNEPYYDFFKNMYGYGLQKEWTVKGEAQFEVGTIFEQEATVLFGNEKKDQLGLAYRWYEYSYDLLPEGYYKEKVLKSLNKVGEKIGKPVLISKKPTIVKKPPKPIIIKNPKEPENNYLQKTLLNLRQKLKSLHISLILK